MSTLLDMHKFKTVSEIEAKKRCLELINSLRILTNALLFAYGLKICETARQEVLMPWLHLQATQADGLCLCLPVM